MWNYEYFVSYTYRWIDFIVILGIATYAFVHWGLSYLKTEIEKEQQLYLSLEKSIQINIEEDERVTQQITLDTLASEKLSEQIIIWRSVVQKQIEKVALAQKDHHVKLEQKHQEKTQAIIQSATEKIIVNTACNNAEQELKHMFQESSIIQEFTKNVLQQMHKETV